MIAIAVLGLFVNSLAAWRMARGHSMNERVLTWHLIGDIASWAVVLFGGVLISLTGWAWLDPLLAIALAAFVAFNVARHLKDTVYLLLQGRPANFDEALFRKDTLAVGGIDHIDQLAVWSLDGDNSILSARLHLHAIRDPMEIEEVKVKVRAVARRQNAQATLETCLAEEASHNESN